MLLCAAALCGGPGSSGWLCKSRSLAYTFTRTYISTTFNDASSMFRCHNGLPIYYCKSQKAWLNATLTSPHALCLNVPWWWWWRRAGGGSTIAILIPSRGRKSPQAFFFCISSFSLPLPLSFSFTETVVIYDQPRDVCFVCSRVPVKYFTARNEHILRNRPSSTNRRIRRAMTLPVSFLHDLLRVSLNATTTKIVKMFCTLFVFISVPRF